jgi:hypothetical protein
VTVTLVSCLYAGCAVAACGVFALGWRRSPTDALVAVPALAAGAAICLAGASRFAALRQDPLTGQELAALVCVAALAAVVLGVGWTARGTPR